ncbi:hypothetical protein BH11PAT3_BH11PAT3_1370 [soil metagenome]
MANRPFCTNTSLFLLVPRRHYMEGFIKGVNLTEASAVLVRFHYTNPKAIPKGLRLVERLSERELVSKRMTSMGVDNHEETYGKQVLHNLDRVQVAFLRAGLANNGFRLVDGHTVDIRQQGKKMKFISTMGFRRLNSGEIPPEIPTEAMADLRTFSTQAVWTAHVWWNPNGVMIIELMMRQPDVSPKCALVVRSGWVGAILTEEFLAEEEESLEFADAILEELGQI